MREKITLECTECKQRNYDMMKKHRKDLFVMVKKTKSRGLSFRTILNMYALIPLIIASCSIGLAVIIIANTQINPTTS